MKKYYILFGLLFLFFGFFISPLAIKAETYNGINFNGEVHTTGFYTFTSFRSDQYNHGHYCNYDYSWVNDGWDLMLDKERYVTISISGVSASYGVSTVHAIKGDFFWIYVDDKLFALPQIVDQYGDTASLTRDLLAGPHKIRINGGGLYSVNCWAGFAVTFAFGDPLPPTDYTCGGEAYNPSNGEACCGEPTSDNSQVYNTGLGEKCCRNAEGSSVKIYEEGKGEKCCFNGTNDTNSTVANVCSGCQRCVAADKTYLSVFTPDGKGYNQRDCVGDIDESKGQCVDACSGCRTCVDNPTTGGKICKDTAQVLDEQHYKDHPNDVHIRADHTVPEFACGCAGRLGAPVSYPSAKFVQGCFLYGDSEDNKEAGASGYPAGNGYDRGVQAQDGTIGNGCPMASSPIRDAKVTGSCICTAYTYCKYDGSICSKTPCPPPDQATQKEFYLDCYEGESAYCCSAPATTASHCLLDAKGKNTGVCSPSGTGRACTTATATIDCPINTTPPTPPGGEGGTHLGCIAPLTCGVVQGKGADVCTIPTQVTDCPKPAGTHYACTGPLQCGLVEGDGIDKCTVPTQVEDCPKPADTHLACTAPFTCSEVPGANLTPGERGCETNDQCDGGPLVQTKPGCTALYTCGDVPLLSLAKHCTVPTQVIDCPDPTIIPIKDQWGCVGIRQCGLVPVGSTAKSCNKPTEATDCNNTPPHASMLSVTPDYCSDSAKFSWLYGYDLVENDPQIAWQVQISTTDNFNTEDDFKIYDSGIVYTTANSVNLNVSREPAGICREHNLVVNPDESVTCGSGNISYGVAYHWRVRVFENVVAYGETQPSAWSNYVDTHTLNAPPNYIDEGYSANADDKDKNPLTYTFPYAHPAPLVSYVASPQTITPGQKISFADDPSKPSTCYNNDGTYYKYFCGNPSVCYDKTGNQNSCGSPFNTIYKWWFKIPGSTPDNQLALYISAHNPDSTSTPNQAPDNTVVTVGGYTQPASYKTALSICDEIACCYAKSSVTVSSSNANTVPQWWEISPY